MEQRIGSSSQSPDVPVVPVVPAAAVDPAYVPGITSPAPVKPQDPAEEAGTEAGPVDAGSEPAPEEPAPADAPDPAAGTETADAAPADEDGEPDGPVFEAADRRASVRADHRGVVLRLDDQEAEFRWDEIGAVETELPRWGKRFTVTVHTPDRRWYPVEIEAAARARFPEWERQLDAVLDAYFQE
ncbi:hypothetical protein ACFYP4_18335 [Streptomyces sp. NPDC005551]|uniref:hypothetical protein n=1 Tax=unclassified Streptomyces TaxID=2593676 RepID=UPI003410A1DA